MTSFEDVRRIALALPEAEEKLTWETDITFRVRDKIFVVMGPDGGGASVKASLEAQHALVASDPETFMMPGESDLRFQWAEARMAKLEFEEMRDLVIYAWSMCVPKYVWEPYVVR